jgi:hypothetical protein
MISAAPSQLLPVFYQWAGDAYARHYPEVADAICHAANTDPIFRDQPLGAAATACILTAEAFERSRFEAYKSRDGGRRLGILQLPRPSTPRIAIDRMIRPKMNCLLGVDLMRMSFSKCAAMRWECRLFWLRRLGRPGGTGWDDPPLDPLDMGKDPGAATESAQSLVRARGMFERVYGKRAKVVLGAFDALLELPSAPSSAADPLS